MCVTQVLVTMATPTLWTERRAEVKVKRRRRRRVVRGMEVGAGKEGEEAGPRTGSRTTNGTRSWMVKEMAKAVAFG